MSDLFQTDLMVQNRSDSRKIILSVLFCVILTYSVPALGHYFCLMYLLHQYRIRQTTLALTYVWLIL